MFPFPQTDLSYYLYDGSAKRGETVQDGDANLELRDLTVEVPCGQALTQQFDAVRFRLCMTSAVIPAPSSPDGSTDTLRRAKDFVSCDSPAGVGFPRLGVLTTRDDCGGTSGGDGVVALAGVESVIGCGAGDLLLGRDLVEQIGHHRCVTHVACDELSGPDLRGVLVYPDVDPAPDPAFGAIILAGVLMPPLYFALSLRMHRRAPNRFHAIVVKVFRQIASDIRRAIIAEQARFVHNLGAVTELPPENRTVTEATI